MSDETHCYGCGEDLAKDGPNGERVIQAAGFFTSFPDVVRAPVCVKCWYRKRSATAPVPAIE